MPEDRGAGAEGWSGAAEMSGNPGKTKKSHEAHRARARDERATRVDRIVAMMADGSWRGMKSWRALSVEYGVGMDAVRDYAREASGILRHAMQGSLEDLRERILLGVEAVTNAALDRKRAVPVRDGGVELVADPDCKAALAGYELQAKMLGLSEVKPGAAHAPQFQSAREMLDYTERMLPLLRQQAAEEDARTRVLAVEAQSVSEHDARR